jgi:hypothetical protein
MRVSDTTRSQTLSVARGEFTQYYNILTKFIHSARLLLSLLEAACCWVAPLLGVHGNAIFHITPASQMRFPLYPAARVPRRRCTRYPVPAYLATGGISSSHFLKITGTGCHASVRLRWPQAGSSLSRTSRQGLAALNAQFISVSLIHISINSHTLVHQGVSACSAAIAEACNVKSSICNPR